MASSKDHWEQARGNESFYEEIGADRSGTPDWAITVLFYAALHYAKAAFAHQGITLGSHAELKTTMRNRFRSVAPVYESLEDASRRARYDCVRPQRDELQRAKQHLSDISDEIAKSVPPTSYV
jgi:hypothetical protein